MHRTRASTVGAVLLGLAAVSCTASDEAVLPAPTTSSAPPPEAPDPAPADGGGGPGAPGIGDPYYPGLGNGGYDVAHYDLDIEWWPDTGTIDATATISVGATQALTSLNLDLAGLDVARITVDGAPAGFRREGRELVVVLPDPLDDGQRARIVVDYSGRPEPVEFGTDLFRVGWQTDGRDAFVVSEPAGAATWFPANDHPRDKATFRFEVTTPADLAVVAAGSLRSSRTVGDRTTWVYDAPDLMATYLASVVIGDLVFGEDRSAGGVPIRNAYPERLAAEAAADFAPAGRMIDVFEDWFGPYPFSVYGQVVVDEALGFALENQTLSLFGADLVEGDADVDRVVAHELAHQWFGNTVSPSTWRDIWLNEGFATYAEWIWEQESGGAPIATTAEQLHASADFGVPPGEPGPDELFQPTVYVRGALALHALSVEIGPDRFREVLTAWVERHDDSSASTADLLALAEELSGQDLDGFFDAWVYGEALPPLP